AVVIGSAFGTASRFRFEIGDSPVDCVPLGVWRREAFDRFGLFDEQLLRNQDNEHSSRIVHAGGTIRRTSRAIGRYRSRSTLRAQCAQAIANGTWNAFTQRLHPHTFRWRHALPGLFFLGVLIAVALIATGAEQARPDLERLGILLVAPYAVANLAS